MVNELTNNNPAPEKKPQLTRREFLRRMLLGAGAVTALAVGVRPVSAQSPGENPSPTPNPTRVEVSIVDSRVEAETVPVAVEKTFGDVIVSLDTEDIPLRYRTGDTAYVFTDEERDTFRAMKERAVQANEPEVAYQKLFEFPTSQTYGEADSIVAEAPSDVLDSDTLRELGVTILNNSIEKGAPQLHLRSSVLEGVLEPLVAFNKNATDLGRVEIIPFAGPSISSIYLPDTITFDLAETRTEFNKVKYDDFLIERANSLQEELEQLRAEEAPSTTSILDVKIRAQLYKGTLSFEQLVDEMTMQKTKALGMFISAYRDDTEETYRGKTSEIYFSNPTAEQLYEKRILSFYYTQEGVFDVVNTSYMPVAGVRHRANVFRSNPSPDEFPGRDPGGDYLYEPNGMGWVILHELAHFVTIDVLPQMIREGTIQQSKLYNEQIATHPKLLELLEELTLAIDTDVEVRDFQRERTIKEHMAELLAMSYFEKAYALYKETGDNSLYCFALEVPATQKNPAGWQITNIPRLAA